MSGPYVISDPTLLSSLVGLPAVVSTGDEGAKEKQCVFLIKKYTNAGSTGGWSKGSNVKNVPNLPTGTAIATFNAQGHYASHSHGNHACFFISFTSDKKGIVVLEQHVKPDKLKIQTRTIYFRGNAKGVSPSDNADAYSVIQ